MSSAKPEPIVDVWNKPFWDACREGRLVLQRCAATGRCWYPPGPRSPYDQRAAWEWVACSGRGTVRSFVIFHQKYFEGYADELPYNVAMVELEEGATLLSNIRSPNAAVRIGAPVTVAFDDRGAFKVPVFTLAGGA